MYPRFIATGFENYIFREYIIYCPKCGSDWLIKSSKNNNGEQRLKCKWCNRRFKYSAHMDESAFLFRLMYFHYKGYSAKMIAKELEVHTSTLVKYTEKYYSVMKYVFADVIREL